jgi:hypothetical protein
MTSLSDFLKNISCTSDCCKSNDIRAEGQNNITFTIDIREPEKVKVKDDETHIPSPISEPKK